MISSEVTSGSSDSLVRTQ